MDSPWKSPRGSSNHQLVLHRVGRYIDPECCFHLSRGSVLEEKRVCKRISEPCSMSARSRRYCVCESTGREDRSGLDIYYMLGGSTVWFDSGVSTLPQGTTMADTAKRKRGAVFE